MMLAAALVFPDVAAAPCHRRIGAVCDADPPPERVVESLEIARSGLPVIVPVTEFRDTVGVALTNIIAGADPAAEMKKATTPSARCWPSSTRPERPRGEGLAPRSVHHDSRPGLALHRQPVPHPGRDGGEG